MLEMIRRVFELAGDKSKKLWLAVILNILQNICTGGVYLVVLRALIKLTEGAFDRPELIFCCEGMGVLLLLRYVVSYGATALQSSLGYEIMQNVRIRESERLEKLPLGDFQSEKLGALTSVFTTDMSFVEMRCIATASTFIAGMTSVVLLSLIMLWLDWRLALIAMVGFVPAWFVYRSAAKAFRTAGVKRQEMEQGFIGGILEYVSGMETIRSYRMSDQIFGGINKHLEGYRDASAAYELKAIPPMMLYQFFIRLGMGLIFACGLMFYLKGMIALPVFLFFAVISATYYQPVEALLGEFGILNIMALSLDHINALHSRRLMLDGGGEAPASHELCAKQATFSYPAKHEPALKDVNAVFRPGELTAIVGHSGSGKTTLLMMLARFWDVQTGSISMGGVDVRDIAIKELMKQFSFVFQDVYLFSGTIEENIRMGRPDASPEEIIAAAKAAGCHDFIMAFPDGYATEVGEGGGLLSGGERQRISIARAILKGAPVVLLDEAFSSVDPENAWAVQQGISALTRDKTVVMVAHTLNHIRHAGQIIVMDEGRPVESGTHDELLARGGVYSQLWEKEMSTKSWKLTA